MDKTAQSLSAPNQVNITGRIDDVRQHEGVYYYHVALPAVDEYSRPSFVSVSSNHPIGSKGDRVEVLCDIMSYFKTFPMNDGGKGRDYKTRFQVK